MFSASVFMRSARLASCPAYLLEILARPPFRQPEQAGDMVACTRASRRQRSWTINVRRSRIEEDGEAAVAPAVSRPGAQNRCRPQVAAQR